VHAILTAGSTPSAKHELDAAPLVLERVRSTAVVASILVSIALSVSCGGTAVERASNGNATGGASATFAAGGSAVGGATGGTSSSGQGAMGSQRDDLRVLRDALRQGLVPRAGSSYRVCCRKPRLRRARGTSLHVGRPRRLATAAPSLPLGRFAAA
jgi:hypothetical protein